MKASAITLIVFLTLSLGIGTLSCSKQKKCKIYNTSTSTKTSHFSGQSCIACHNENGKGGGCFSTAGTIQTKAGESIDKGYVTFTTEKKEKGELKFKLYLDASGNFYTTEKKDLINLYVTVTGPTGKKQYMDRPLSTGDCMSCHSVNQDQIWVEN